MEHLPSFLMGLAGSTHSLGMCGGAIFSLSLVSCDRSNRFFALSLYSSGYVFTYVFLGALAGTVGRTLVEGGLRHDYRQPLILLIGIFLFLISLQMMGLFSRLNALNHLPGSSILERVITRLHVRPARLTPFYLGLFNGFLPGPLVYAGLAMAVVSASAPSGMLAMFVFALGTLPLFWLLGASGFVFSPSTRARLIHVMAIVVLAVGCVVMWGGLNTRDGSHTADGAASLQIPGISGATQ